MSALDKVYNVAIVDDHKMFNDAFKILLRDLKLASSINSYYCAEEFLIELDHKTFDIVFMDIAMPGMKGDEATRRIKLFNSNIKVIALSFCTDGYTAQKMFDAGIDGYITKTQTSAILKDLFDHIDKGITYISPEISLNLTFQTSEMDLNLSDREIEIIKCIDKGKTNREIANVLLLSERTIEDAKRKIAKMLGVKTTLEILGMAYRLRILP